MTTTEINSITQNAISKIGGNAEIYMDVFHKVLYAPEPLILSGDDCAIGKTLHEFGLLNMDRKPIWANGAYRGNWVYFSVADIK